MLLRLKKIYDHVFDYKYIHELQAHFQMIMYLINIKITCLGYMYITAITIDIDHVFDPGF